MLKDHSTEHSVFYKVFFSSRFQYLTRIESKDDGDHGRERNIHFCAFSAFCVRQHDYMIK